MRYSPVFSMILSFDFWSNYACFIAFIFSIYIFLGGGIGQFFLKKAKEICQREQEILEKSVRTTI